MNYYTQVVRNVLNQLKNAPGNLVAHHLCTTWAANWQPGNAAAGVGVQEAHWRRRPLLLWQPLASRSRLLAALGSWCLASSMAQTRGAGMDLPPAPLLHLLEPSRFTVPAVCHCQSGNMAIFPQLKKCRSPPYARIGLCLLTASM